MAHEHEERSALISVKTVLLSSGLYSQCESQAYGELADSCKRGRLDVKIVKLLLSSATKVFEARFAVEGAELGGKDASVALRFNLDGDDATISIPLTTLASRADDSSNAVVLSPLVSMLCEATKCIAKGSLESVDAILGCPLW